MASRWLGLVAVPFCFACSGGDQAPCASIDHNGISAAIDGESFELRCGVAVAGGNQNAQQQYADAPEGMTLELSTGPLDCDTNAGWRDGKQVFASVWRREAGIYDDAEGLIVTITGKHGTGYPDLASTITIDEVADTRVRGNIDVRYYTLATAAGSFDVKKCF